MQPVISGVIGGLIAVLLTAYVASRVGKGGKPGELRYGGVMWALAVACLVFAILPVAATFAGNDEEIWAKVAIFVFFGLSAAYCFGEAALVRGHFNDDSIEFHTPWSGTKRENWINLESVEFVALCSWYTLTFASGKKIRLSQYLVGHLSAVEMAESKRSAKTRGDA